MKQQPGVSRRDFMRGAAAAGAALGGLTILGATARGQGKTLKIGLVGCGGRGRGAMVNHIEAAKSLGLNAQVTALADAYMNEETIPKALFSLKTKAGQEVPKDRCFVGFDGYKKLIDSGVDIVLLATPPIFRPVHFAAAIEAGKHVFMEKPVAVDPVGGRRVIEAGEKAKTKGLSIVAGTQRRHHRDYLAVYKLIQDGVIGPIRGGAVWWCDTQQRARPRQPGWSDRDYMVANWNNFVEMSGDHIIEQHVHNIDVANWFLGTPPSLAVGFGGRARRKTGNQFDFFSVDFQYKLGPKKRQRVHIHSMSRQVNKCWNREAEEFIGEKGYVMTTRLRLYDRTKVKKPEIAGHVSPYVQEHVDLLKSVVGDKEPLNEAQHVAESTLAGIMGRISAYTGQAVRFSDVAKETGQFGKLALKPGPLDFETGDVKAPPDNAIPIPGSE